MQFDSWADVRYKLHMNNKKCYRDKSQNIICTYLAIKWNNEYV